MLFISFFCSCKHWLIWQVHFFSFFLFFFLLLSEVLVEDSTACFYKALGQLQEIWDSIGIPEDHRLQRVQCLLDMMIAEEKSLKERLLKRIDSYQKEQDTLIKELKLEPFLEREETTMLELEQDLQTQIEELKRQKEERLQEQKLLQEQDQKLCEILCVLPYGLDNDSVLSIEELNQFRNYLAALEETKASRWEDFVSTKKQILLCMEDLGHTPETDFERDVVYKNEETFCLSLENLTALKNLLLQLEMEKAENEAVCKGLRSRIRELWLWLQISTQEREALAMFMTGSKAKIRKVLQLDMDRLEDLRIQNLKKMIEASKVELALYWEKCFYSQQQKEAFTYYYNEDYTEILLKLHGEEIVKLKQYYKLHKELFEGVQKWEKNWRLFLEFERKASDPSRFMNRGGNLLKEEKQRAKLQKILPKLEEELKAQIEMWEKEHSKAFVVNGQKFIEYIMEQWEMFHLKKDKEEQERQLKKNQQTGAEMLYSSRSKILCKKQGLRPNSSGKGYKPVMLTEKE
ncbi:protein regulator of cytokinesis 1-like [Vombatus ursinus]|uniref:protein regulator of cytokinesis 1-like n=1 Tax=Vombatus ursinus TaxID=29139 RepID=UPI000FFD80A8|nr:protein regulator of cytokinesis 1-like [Vombatus ursinus]